MVHERYYHSDDKFDRLVNPAAGEQSLIIRSKYLQFHSRQSVGRVHTTRAAREHFIRSHYLHLQKLPTYNSISDSVWADAGRQGSQCSPRAVFLEG